VLFWYDDRRPISSLENVLPGGGVHRFSTWKSSWKWGCTLWKRQVIVKRSWHLTPSVSGHFCAHHTGGVKCWLHLTISPKRRVPPPTEFISGTFVDILNCGRSILLQQNVLFFHPRSGENRSPHTILKNEKARSFKMLFVFYSDIIRKISTS
jgi:hypothetical protein